MCTWNYATVHWLRDDCGLHQGLSVRRRRGQGGKDELVSAKVQRRGVRIDVTEAESQPRSVEKIQK